ncbi:MAG: hypothetical protein GY859_33845 [Desulfobacterales bacterium]|nr:hypothetical protein [Desulfobacterales bacterium]
MTTFDIGAAIAADAANQFFSVVHAQLRAELFSGSAIVQDPSGTGLIGDYEISWDVAKAPVLDFTPPSRDAAEALSEEKIADKELPGELGNDRAELKKEMADAAVRSCFGMKIPNVAVELVELVEEGENKTSAYDIGFDLLVQLKFKDRKLSIEPVRATVVRADDIEWIVTDYVLPFALELVRSLHPVGFPTIDIDGLSLAPPLPCITDGRAVGMTNRIERKTPSPPSGFSWPDEPFCLLIKPGFITHALNDILAGQVLREGRPYKPDSFDVDINAWLEFSNITPRPSPSPVEFDVSLDAKGTAKATVTLFGFEFGYNFYIRPTHPVTGRAGVRIENNGVRVKLLMVNEISLEIDSDNPLVSFLTFLPRTILNVFGETLVPAVVGKLHNLMDRELFSIQEIPIPPTHPIFTIKIDDAKLGGHDNYTAFTSKILFT